MKADVTDGHIEVSMSVVIYRDYDTPAELLDSVVTQTDPRLSLRIYFVDNDAAGRGEPLSTSRSEFLEVVGRTDMATYIDAGSNLGYGRANNLALMRADSDYHAFVNPDVLFVSDALGALKGFMDSNPDVGMCIPRMLGEDGSLQRVYRREVTVLDALNRTLLGNRLRGRDRWHTLAEEDYEKPFRVPFGQGSFLFGRTSLLKELGGFDDSYFMYLEDADLCRRVNQVSSFMYCPDATVVHKWERGSHKDPRLLMRHLKSYATYFRKWGLTLA